MTLEDQPKRFAEFSEQEQARIRKAGSSMTHFAFDRSTAIILAAGSDDTSYFGSGSGFVLRHGDGEYLGTAWHVVEAWQRKRDEGSRVLFQAGQLALNPLDRIVWRDEQNDVVLLRLEPGEAARVGREPCEAPLGWPPPHPAEGSFLLLSGFPGAMRSGPTGDEVGFKSFAALMRVTISRERYLVCQFERDYWVPEDNLLSTNLDLGGLSGGPVFLVTDLSYPLVGLISEFSRDFELLYVKTLSHAPANLRSAA